MCFDFGIIEMAMMMSALSVATSVAGTVVSAQAQQKQMFDTKAYQDDMYSQTGKAAQANYEQQMSVENQRLMQSNLAASQQSQQNQLQGAQAMAHAGASADAAGVGGSRSVSDLYQSFGAIQARNQDALNINQSFGQMQAMQDEKAMQANARNHIASAMPGPVQGVNSLGVGLNVLGSIQNGYDKYSQATGTGMYDPGGRSNSSSGKSIYNAPVQADYNQRYNNPGNNAVSSPGGNAYNIYNLA